MLYSSQPLPLGPATQPQEASAVLLFLGGEAQLLELTLKLAWWHIAGGLTGMGPWAISHML